MSDLIDSIKDAALNPKEIEGDMGRVLEHPIKDLIEADRYLKNQALLKTSNPLRLFKISPGSTVGGGR